MVDLPTLASHFLVPSAEETTMNIFLCFLSESLEFCSSCKNIIFCISKFLYIFQKTL